MAKKPTEAIVYKDIDGNVVVEEFRDVGSARSRERQLRQHDITAIATLSRVDWIETEEEYKKLLAKAKSRVKAMRDKKSVFDEAIQNMDARQLRDGMIVNPSDRGKTGYKLFEVFFTPKGEKNKISLFVYAKNGLDASNYLIFNGIYGKQHKIEYHSSNLLK